MEHKVVILSKSATTTLGLRCSRRLPQHAATSLFTYSVPWAGKFGSNRSSRCPGQGSVAQISIGAFGAMFLPIVIVFSKKLFIARYSKTLIGNISGNSHSIWNNFLYFHSGGSSVFGIQAIAQNQKKVAWEMNCHSKDSSSLAVCLIPYISRMTEETLPLVRHFLFLFSSWQQLFFFKKRFVLN